MFKINTNIAKINIHFFLSQRRLLLNTCYPSNYNLIFITFVQSNKKGSKR